MELKQYDTNFNRRIFKIMEDGVHVTQKGMTSSYEYFVEFEEIGTKTSIQKSRNLIWISLSILLLIICISVFINRINGGKVGNGAEVFHFVSSAIFYLVFILTRKNTFTLLNHDNTSGIDFIGSSRYRNKVDNFINLIHEKRKLYLIEKYTSLNDFMPYEQQYNDLIWLYKIKLLSEEELKSKIQLLNEIDFSSIKENIGKSDRIIGFRKSFESELDEDDY